MRVFELLVHKRGHNRAENHDHTRISMAVWTLVATPALSKAACRLSAFMQVASILHTAYTISKPGITNTLLHLFSHATSTTNASRLPAQEQEVKHL